MRYHMAGQRLVQDLISDMESTCDMPDVKVVDAEHASTLQTSEAGTCRNLKLSLDEDTLQLWPYERLKNLSQPRNNTRFVHLIREPLGLLAEYYTSHAVTPGPCRPDSAYSALCTNLTKMTAVDGMVYVAESRARRS